MANNLREDQKPRLKQIAFIGGEVDVERHSLSNIDNLSA